MSKELDWDISLIDAAMAELAAETRRIEIDAAKVRLRQRRPLWHRVFPWKITLTRR